MTIFYKLLNPKKRDKFSKRGESYNMPHCFFFQQQHVKVSDKFIKCQTQFWCLSSKAGATKHVQEKWSSLRNGYRFFFQNSSSVINWVLNPALVQWPLSRPTTVTSSNFLISSPKQTIPTSIQSGQLSW